MAEVTLLHLLNFIDDAEERDSPIEFVTTTDHNHDPYWSSDFDFFIPDRSPEIQPSYVLPRRRNSITRRPSLDFDNFDDEDDGVNPESVADLPGRENQNNFVIDLLHQRVEQSQWSTEHVVLDPEEDPVLDLNFGVIEGNEEMGSAQLDHDIGLGFIEEPTSLTDERSDFVGENVDGERRLVTGLRLVEIGSDSDSDFNLDGVNLNAAEARLQAVDIGSDSVSDLNLDGINFGADDIQDASGDDNDDQSLGLCWDSFQIEDPQDIVNEFDWEEVVEEVVDEIEVLSTLYDGSLTAHEERSSTTVGNVEWQEVMVRMDGYHDTEDDDDDEGLNEFSFDDNDLDEYNYATDYEMFFGHFGENEEIPILGRPPAAKNVVKNLPVIVLSKEDVEKTNAFCAICRDEMEAGEAVKQLSCCHKFHGDCILPWLGIRNTCPVCRFELPTDDPEYEKRKDVRANQIH